MISLRFEDHYLSELLVRNGVISKSQASHTMKLASSWGSSFLDTALETSLIDEDTISKFLAECLSLKIYHYDELGGELLSEKDASIYLSLLALPVGKHQDKVIIACFHPNDKIKEWADKTYKRGYIFAIATRSDIVKFIKAHFSEGFSQAARHKLYTQRPLDSAKYVLTLSQKIIFATFVAWFAYDCAFNGAKAAIAIVVATNIYYLFVLVFKALLMILGSSTNTESEVSQEEIDAITDDELPVYTVMVPLYKETEILPYLIQNLRELQYPRSKLDIKIILEGDDLTTIEALKTHQLESYFDAILVPPSLPRTKPKAMNYALPFARGDLLTIYDAEDRPEADQLKKAYVLFKRMPEVSCVQGRLNYFNRNENMLTRMFTIEYSQWFDYLLIGLYRLKIPIPLGGTSNHFRTQVLLDLGAWDPYNVTEDADLGLRFEKTGHKVAIVNSTTFEEATTQLPTWIKQRSRWIKGYMQTFLIHLRNPIQFFREVGPIGLFGYFMFIGGPCLVGILNPILWGIFIADFFIPSFSETYFPPIIQDVALFNLVVGNAIYVIMGYFSCGKRKYKDLAKYSPFLLIYWFFYSVAAYKALWQLIWNPHYWEKTTHGVSKQLGVKPGGDQAPKQDAA